MAQMLTERYRDRLSGVLSCYDRIRQRAEQLAAEQGARIEYIAKTHIREDDVVTKLLAARGEHPGLVHVLSAMKSRESYQP